MKKKSLILLLTLALLLAFLGETLYELRNYSMERNASSEKITDLADALNANSNRDARYYEPYSGTDYDILNGNKPYFTDAEIVTECYEHYSPLDEFGRCHEATACLGKETLPEKGEERGDISNVHPSGWVQAQYDIIAGEGNASGYLLQRAHLIAWCLAAENDNELNLISGTRNMNETMWIFEQQVQDYIYNHIDNHVMYRVTPIYDDDCLMCYGVTMEAWSVEDDGELSFCVMCYNNQPFIEIDYYSGQSREMELENAA